MLKHFLAEYPKLNCRNSSSLRNIFAAAKQVVAMANCAMVMAAIRIKKIMARTKRTFNLDTRITDALEAAADQAGYASINQFVEGVLFWALKIMGRIPADALPLPEMRGGKRNKNIEEEE